ncbi:MAG: non-canonical purine NTP pyrophosphatase [Pirellulales bacterium]
MPLLVLGTHNRKKGREMAELLAPHGIGLRTLADYPAAIEVVEDGDSFAANARLKAKQQAVHLGEWVLAEDSGLSVDALRGAPGIYSARYAGERADDEQNNAKLLVELRGVSTPSRTAHYTCHMTLCDPQGVIRAEAERTCHGVIRAAPAGTGGFGYDPLFEVRELHRTFGELGPTVKRVLSHRARATYTILPQLLRELNR